MTGVAVVRGQRGPAWLRATLYDALMARAARGTLRQLRRETAGAATGRVLEIGAGTGLNIPYYTSADAVYATEPDQAMLHRARRRARGAHVRPTLLRCAADDLPFADGTIDTVVATLVLCSVGDQRRVLAEVRRVLVTGGAFRFIEHIREDNSALGRMQDSVTPLWRRCAGGCHLNRRTVAAIEAAGFEVVTVRHERVLHIPVAIGVARRGP